MHVLFWELTLPSLVANEEQPCATYTMGGHPFSQWIQWRFVRQCARRGRAAQTVE
jgi:hypothetical protein